MASGIKNRQLYPPAVRSFVISMRNISPVAYEFMRETFQKELPHSKTIISWHANSNILCEPGIIAFSLNLLKKRVSELNESIKKLIGGILFDKMSGREHLKWTNDGFIGFAAMPGLNKAEAAVGSEYLVFMFSALITTFGFRLPTTLLLNQ